MADAHLLPIVLALSAASLFWISNMVSGFPNRSRNRGVTGQEAVAS